MRRRETNTEQRERERGGEGLEGGEVRNPLGREPAGGPKRAP